MKDGFKDWQDKTRRDSSVPAMTGLEVRDWLGHLECDLCSHFSLDTEKCDLGKRPRLIVLLDGPQDHCHAHKSCLHFTKADTERVDGVAHWLSSGTTIK